MTTTEEEDEEMALCDLFGDEPEAAFLPSVVQVKEKQKISDKTKQALRRIYALYNCSKQEEFLTFLRDYVFDFYKLAESNSEFYQDETLLV